MKKHIIGLIGNKKNTTEVLNVLKDIGFIKFSIFDKVKNIAKFLLKKEDCDNELLLNKVRDSSYKISNSYWINLLLVTEIVKNDSNLIVIDDLIETDAVPSIIEVIRITDENIDDVKKDIEKRCFLE